MNCQALNTPISKDSEYHISYPWKYGTLNNQDYNSIQHVLSDIEAIWTDTIVNELKVERISFQVSHEDIKSKERRINSFIVIRIALLCWLYPIYLTMPTFVTWYQCS